MWSIIVHGGAGAIKDALEERHVAGCGSALAAGRRVLERGGSSLDAVCAAVRVLEDDPTYNASFGAALDERGLPTVDAAVMRGSDLAYGAIGSVAGIRRAIDLARAVLEDGRHCLLVGRSALDFARRKNVPRCDPASLVVERAEADLARKAVASAGDTVGAVARDEAGVIAAATSTGGLVARYAGRVGDSPIAGAGTYARDDLGGASATGHGETMMRTVLAYRVLAALSGVEASEARAVIQRELDEATARTGGGKGGLIAVLPSGDVVWARNTRHMGVAWASSLGSAGTDF